MRSMKRSLSNTCALFIMFALSALVRATAQTVDKTVVITSDWHLSDSRSFDSSYYYAWTDKNKDCILSFLNNLSNTRNEWDVLVLNGDIFEFWRSPADMFMVADDNGNVIDDVAYLGRIREQNKEIFTVLESLRANGKEIVYLPGNHDITVSSNDIETAFPGLFTCSYDTESTGLYEPFGEGTAVAIEHGNRYEYFNAPYQHGVFASDGTSSSSVLPPGYFTSKLGATATVYSAGQYTGHASTKAKSNGTLAAVTEETDAGNRTYLSTSWNLVRSGSGSPTFTVRTCIDGVGSEQKDYCDWTDYAMSETNNPTLFKNSWTVENWKKRCELNKVPVYLTLVNSLLSSALKDVYDKLAFTERLCNEQQPTLICVWGHSHSRKLQTSTDALKGDVVYLNEGAWVDDTDVCTFGVIRYIADNHTYSVELHQLDAGGEDSVVDSRCLYVPENNSEKLADGTWRFNAKAKLVDAAVTSVVSISNASTPAAVYNLNGVRVSHASDGIYVINGRKVLLHLGN